MAKNRVPILVKHMTVAIFKKGGIDGSTEKERFISAWNIARARLTEYGFLAPGSDKGPEANIKLTGKGVKRETLHRREAERGPKDALFDKMFDVLLDQEIEGKPD